MIKRNEKLAHKDFYDMRELQIRNEKMNKGWGWIFHKSTKFIKSGEGGQEFAHCLKFHKVSTYKDL